MENNLAIPARHEFFGFGWEFHYGDLKEREAWTEQDFRPVQLPHDWLMDYEAPDKDEKSGAMNWKYGVGIYRKEFTVDPVNEGRKLFLHFDGAYQDSTVYLNGTELGNHFYGYTPFEYEITDYVKYDAPNRLVVRVDNSDQPNTRWYSGSGIDRDVWIDSVSPVHVASEGTYIVTKSIDNGFADLVIETEIMNQSGEDCEILVVNEIFAPDGKLVAKLPQRMTVGAAAGTVILKQEIALKDPELWSTESPAMHKMLTKIYADSKEADPLDVYTTPFGIRTIRFDADRGFLLNGKQVKINGMAIHNEAGQLGAAVPIRVWRRRFEKLQEMGCNAIRTAHNPADPLILDLMDEMGLLCMNEFFDEWTICKWSKSRGNPDVPPKGYAHRWEELHVKDAETIIRRDRNHPCVILWSVGNECEEVYTVDGWEVMKELQEICHRMDPTRPVTEGTNLLAHNSAYTYEKFMEYEDVWGFNWINIWEPRAELLYEPDKIKHPDVPMVITETGGCAGSRGSYPLPERRSGGGRFGGSPYYSWPVAASKHLRFILTHDYISGVFYWTGVDYMGESPYPIRGGEHAPVGLDGYIKDNWYFYKSMWKHDEPMVYIFPHWNMDVPEGKIIPVLCYTSCPSVELFVNGKSYGEKACLYPADGIDEWPKFDLTKPTANTDDLFLSWDVPYEKGEVIAVGYDRDGKEIARYSVKTVGEAAKIIAKTDRTEIPADGREIVQIEIELQDHDGNFAILSENELKLDFDGPAELLVVENGNGRDHSLGRNPVRKAHYGRLFAVLRSKREEKGTVKVRISGEGLQSAELQFECI
ncbi:MAG: DUF4982 domain-containing protein [Lachnospiraceae bacterium]|nr:DUF4982 domain-containing protein [Lachnospiraceae bacterium]